MVYQNIGCWWTHFRRDIEIGRQLTSHDHTEKKQDAATELKDRQRTFKTVDANEWAYQKDNIDADEERTK